MVSVWKLRSDRGKTTLEFIRAASTLDAGSQELAPGVYTTFRTYNHDRVLRLQEHFDRLVKSAELQDVHARLDQENVRKGLLKIVADFPIVDVRLRIHWSLEKQEQTVFLMGEEFTPFPEVMYIQGVAAQTVHLSRKNPLSKATNFINETRELRAARPADVHEYLMVGTDGELLEGMTSNVFCIKNGTLYTASSGILLGITRQLTLEAVGHLSVPVVHQGLNVKDLTKVDEVFITSASRGVLPVTILDGKKISSGKPGVITQRIRIEFNKNLLSELENL
jgi:branched-subunit amino acid aminotransferase/4-amino-4-deoxychorismate lyase